MDRINGKKRKNNMHFTFHIYVKIKYEGQYRTQKFAKGWAES